MIRAACHRACGDTRGATATEFALIAPMLCLLLLGFLDLGYRTYVASVVHGALHDVARIATVGTSTSEEVNEFVNDRLVNFSAEATVVVRTLSYADFSDVAKPEVITQDTAPFNEYNEGDCYADANDNEQYDLDRGADGLGSAEDIVHYEVEMTFPRIVPMGKLLGLPDTETIRSSTVLRNQPFAARSTTVATICD